MATLILTTVGTAIGGPLGGAIGALVGQAADARLFAPRGRPGPRLSDLRVQTSSYGTAIPRLYGRMRVSGTVIWADDLVEHRNRSGGKGRPTVTTYSYSASFAVALSSRAIADVGRIWAEGNILRGSDGGFKSATRFRIHNGVAGQPVDPLIASAEGIGHCPAYRDIAYVVFEDMDLSPFGNRIPSLSFEIVADETPPSLGSIAADIVGADADAVTIADAGPTVTGYAVTEDQRRAAIARLDRIVPTRRIAGSPQRWRVGEAVMADPDLLPEAVVAEGRRRGNRSQYGAAGQRPRHVVVDHFDPARDYQLSRQSGRVAGGDGPAEEVALPIAMDAAQAKMLAASLAGRAAYGSAKSEYAAGLAALALPLGTLVSDATDRRWRISERRISATQLLLDLEHPAPAMASTVPPADGGRALAAPDNPVGTTQAFVFDLPRWDAGPTTQPGGPVILAAGTGVGWRSAQVALRATTGGPLAPVGPVLPSSALGSVVAVESAAQPHLIDWHGHIDVVLLRGDMQLANASAVDLSGGTNLAIAGQELIQFARANPLGGSMWRLSGLLRGRLGTDLAMAALSAGAGFALLDAATTLALPGHVALTPLSAGAQVEVGGVADETPLQLPIPHPPRARRPLSPVHLYADWQDDGGLLLRWTRRSRLGFAWTDGLDVPVDGTASQFRVALTAGAVGAVHMVDTAHLTIPAGDIAAFPAVATGIDVAVTQLVDSVESAATHVTIPFNFVG